MTVRLAVLFCCVATSTAVAAPAAGPQDEHVALQAAHVAVQSAHVALQPAQVAVPGKAAKLVYAEQESPAQYEYEYSVKDPHSGDDKEMKEDRSGNDVKGFYAFVQPDGVRRIVEYSSSKEHGFNAVVRYEGQPAAAPVEVVYTAQGPVTYASAPSIYAPHQAPIGYVQAPAPRIVYAPAPQVAHGSYPQAQPVPGALTSVQAAPFAFIQGRTASSPASASQVAYAPLPTLVRYTAQPAVTVAPAHRIIYAQAPKISYTQSNLAYEAQPQVAYPQASAQVAYSAAPVAYVQAPLAKLAYAQPASANHAAAPIAKLNYAK